MRNAFKPEIWNAIVVLARARTSREEIAKTEEQRHADSLIDAVIEAARKVIDRDHL